MLEQDIQSALSVALNSPLEEVVTHALIISEQLKTLEQLGGLTNRGKDLYDEIRAVSLCINEGQFLVTGFITSCKIILTQCCNKH